MARGWDPAWPQGRDPDQGKDPGEGCLPWGDPASTSPWTSCSWVSSRDLTERRGMTERKVGGSDGEEGMIFAKVTSVAMQNAKVSDVNVL